MQIIFKIISIVGITGWAWLVIEKTLSLDIGLFLNVMFIGMAIWFWFELARKLLKGRDD
jgi:hypothetical protein